MLAALITGRQRRQCRQGRRSIYRDRTVYIDRRLAKSRTIYWVAFLRHHLYDLGLQALKTLQFLATL